MYVKEDEEYNKLQGEKDLEALCTFNKIMDTVSNYIATASITFLTNFNVASMKIPITYEGSNYIINVSYDKEK